MLETRPIGACAELKPVEQVKSEISPVELVAKLIKEELQSLQLNWAMEHPMVIRPIIEAFPDLSRPLFLRWSNTFTFSVFIRFNICGRTQSVLYKVTQIKAFLTYAENCRPEQQPYERK